MKQTPTESPNKAKEIFLMLQYLGVFVARNQKVQ